MITPVFFWVLVALTTLLAELFIPGLFFALSFSFGSGAAAIAAVYGYDLDVQASVLVGSALCIFILLRALVRRAHRHTGLKTNT